MPTPLRSPVGRASAVGHRLSHTPEYVFTSHSVRLLFPGVARITASTLCGASDIFRTFVRPLRTPGRAGRSGRPPARSGLRCWSVSDKGSGLDRVHRAGGRFVRVAYGGFAALSLLIFPLYSTFRVPASVCIVALHAAATLARILG